MTEFFLLKTYTGAARGLEPYCGKGSLRWLAPKGGLICARRGSYLARSAPKGGLIWARDDAGANWSADKKPDKLTEWGRLFCSCGCLLMLIPVAIFALTLIWALLTGE